ncbi:MAG TPA: carbamoyltransferase [Candidatus Omnitrophota bacterium]|nr:carbamoyltransferase [Candidatus Omnitrophota bacterium]
MATNILGISAFYHDSAAALIRDGEIIAAAQEERFSRKRNDSGFPREAIKFCLDYGKIDISRLDYVALHENPFLKLHRLINTYLAYSPWGLRSFVMSAPSWIKEKIFLKSLIKYELRRLSSQKLANKFNVIFIPHNDSHAASAFYPSPFQSAALLTLDGVGEQATANYGTGRDNNISSLGELRFPHSLGLLYSAFTYYTGFKVNSAEYKVMGLAPYGETKYAGLILDKLIDLKEDGSFRLNMDYFNYCVGFAMTNKKFDKLFGGPPRKPESKLTQKDMDLAKSIQVVTEEIMLRMVRHVHKETGEDNLCLAGGVALNCVANGRILRESPFKNIWIQPASGDAGACVGAALDLWYRYLGNKRNSQKNDSMRASLLGPEFSDENIEGFLRKEKIAYRKFTTTDALIDVASDLIAKEKVIGWFEGRMEFGSRALGARSIIADSRSKKMQSILNLKIKYRESFRPFAPTVLEEKAADYFELDRKSPYMLLVALVKKERCLAMPKDQNLLSLKDKINIPRSDIPAVTHFDYSARIQTVNAEQNKLFYRLIKKFEEKTGFAVVVNTSFNVRGEPIVLSPEDAFRCFMRTEMDYLVIGNFLIDKQEQRPVEHDTQWQREFELD